MKNKSNLFFCLLFIFFNFSYSVADTKIAYIDLDNIFQKSNHGKKIISKLNEINNKNISKLNEINNKNISNIKVKENEIIELDKEVKIKKNLITENDLNLMISDLNNKVSDLKIYRDNLIKNYEESKNNEIKEFFNRINPILQDYMRKNSIDFILDKKNIFIATKNNDITDIILELINNNIK